MGRIQGVTAGTKVVFEGDNMLGFDELQELDIGLQLGEQAFRQIIFFKTED